MPSWLAPIVELGARLNLAIAVDIAITAFLIYQFLTIIRGRRAAHVLVGFTVLALFYVVSISAGLTMLRTVLETAAPYSAFALIVMFQSEIRRMLTRIGRQGLFGLGGRLKRKEFIDELLPVLEQLSRTRTGALIVIERDVGLRTFAESGVLLDAAVSRELLLAIFHPGAALHDGAVIIQNERITAAACFLPLTMNPEVTSTLGTRHRAAIGVTEESDCLALVVSEKTGAISAASFGEIYQNLTIEQVDEIAAAHLGGRTKEEPLVAEEADTPADAHGGARPVHRQ